MLQLENLHCMSSFMDVVTFILFTATKLEFDVGIGDLQHGRLCGVMVTCWSVDTSYIKCRGFEPLTKMIFKFQSFTRRNTKFNEGS